MHSFNVHFAQAQTYNENRAKLRVGYIEALHIKPPICARLPISQDRLAVFTNYPSVTKDQALEETVLTLWFTAAFNPSVLLLRIQ